MHLAEERQQMVLAKGVEVYVFDDDHVLVVILKEGRAQDGIGVLFVAFGEVLESLPHPFGRALQTLSVDILSKCGDD